MSLLVPSLAAGAIGGLDPSFGTGGIAITDITGLPFRDDGNALALDASGRLVVAGMSSTPDHIVSVVRYDANGALDPTFGTGGIVTTALPDMAEPEAVAIDAAGNVVVAGWRWAAASPTCC